MITRGPRAWLLPLVALLLGLLVALVVLEPTDGDLSPGLLAADGADEVVPAPGSTALPAQGHVSESQSVANAATQVTEPSARAVVPDAAVNSSDLVVQVVDVAGNPVANLPLLIGSEAPPRDLEEAVEAGFLLARTDPQGRAVFPGERGRLGSEDSGSYSLYHFVAFEERPTLTLTASVLAQEVLRSVQPPFGSLEVHLSELDGRAVEDIESVVLELVLHEEGQDPTQARNRPGFVTECVQGIASFPFVEPGRDWEAVATRGQTGYSSRARGAGPYSPLSSARIDLQMGSDRPIVKVRLVDSTGHILAGQRVEVEASETLSGLRSSEYVTNEGGWMWLEIDGELHKIWPPRMTVTRSGQAGTPTLSAVLGPLEGLELGLNTVEDLVLVSDQLLVTGRVLDETGRAVQGAKVGFGPDVDFEFARFGGFLGPQAPDYVDSDQEGHFEFFGALSSEQRYVWATLEHSGGSSDRRSRSRATEVLQAGAQVDLVLEQVYRPRVELLLSAALSAEASLASQLHMLTVTVEPAGKNRQIAQSSLAMDTTGVATVTFELAPTGRYDVRCKFGDHVLAESLGVPLSGDEVLTRLDLRGLLHLHRLRLLAPPGSGAEDDITGNFRLRKKGGQDEEEMWVMNSFRESLIQILTISATVDVHVLPDAFREEHIEGLGGEREIVLRPPLQVRLVLVTDGRLPSAPYIFDPDPRFEGRSIGVAIGPRWFTEEKRESVFLLPRAGTISVGWHFEKRLSNGAIGSQALYGHEVEIEVLDVPGEQRFELLLDGAALTKLVENPPY